MPGLGFFWLALEEGVNPAEGTGFEIEAGGGPTVGAAFD